MRLMLNKVHHIAIICSNYEISKKFYVEILGLEILQEVYRTERQSYKLDLALQGNYAIELFSFHNPSKRKYQLPNAGLQTERTLVYFAAYKNHIGFYPTGSVIKAFQVEIAGYKTLKVQFSFS